MIRDAHRGHEGSANAGITRRLSSLLSRNRLRRLGPWPIPRLWTSPIPGLTLRSKSPEPSSLSEQAEAIAAGYALEGTSLQLGRLVEGSDVVPVDIRIPLSMLNRHGLVAGATGTGKTKTLQLITEQLSAAGVPVFAADIKGDLSGLATPGRGQREAAGAYIVARSGLEGDVVPGRVLGAGRRRARRADPGDDDGLRADPAGQGARPQRDAGVVARARLPLRRQGRDCRCWISRI